jgi:hypothetical protein
MQHRRTVSDTPKPRKRGDVRRRTAPLRLHLVKLQAGVAAGSTTRSEGNVRAEWWALFASLEQFESCWADDPLRFADPLLFSQVQAKAEKLFDR